jgi:CheY-like chemotaxis protein
MKGAEAPKVVVVDDDESFRDLIRLHLGNAGYQPLMAEDAVAAGHLIVEHHPSLVLIDVKMPYMDGYEFAAALKADPQTRDIPIIFVTIDENVAERSRELGAVAYLHKPVRADQLLELVQLFAPAA